MQNLQFFESQIQMPLVPISVRATLVKLSSGNVLISPIRFSEDDLQELRKSPPATIVAPNNWHHLYVSKAKTNFPAARLYCAPGLQEKRADVAWDETLNPDTWPHHGELPMVLVEGMPKINEAVFYHPASKTLIVTDLLFNLKNRGGWRDKLLFGLMGTFNRTAVSRLFNMMMKDRRKARASIRRILSFDFENIVMAHGELISGNGKEVFQKACTERGLL